MAALTANRPWLADRRAFTLFSRWKRAFKGQPKYLPEGTDIEHFRWWSHRTYNHFFDITGVWPEQAVYKCSVALSIEPPTLPSGMLNSWSEDEVICRSQEGRILLYHDRTRDDRPRTG